MNAVAKLLKDSTMILQWSRNLSCAVLVVITLLLGSITACGFQTAQDFSSSLPPDTKVTLEDALVNTEWQLITVNGEPFPEEMQLTMFLTPEGVYGHTGCNDWEVWGIFTAEGGEIFTDMKIIKETGGCAYRGLGKKFAVAFSAATRYSFEGEMLRFWNESDDQEILFAPLEE